MTWKGGIDLTIDPQDKDEKISLGLILLLQIIYDHEICKKIKLSVQLLPDFLRELLNFSNLTKDVNFFYHVIHRDLILYGIQISHHNQ